jgi:MOSC domain-containing protein YiiM
MKYVTQPEIDQRLPWVLESPSDTGSVELLVVRPQTNQRKTLTNILFSPEIGATGDNWKTQCWKKLSTGQADPVVQVAIMNARMIDVLAGEQSRWPLAGDQLFVDFDLSVANLSPGDRLQIGGTVLEITAEPHRGCRKFKQRFGSAALHCVNSPQGDAHRLRGVYAKIIAAGEVRVGDVIHKQ